MNKTLTLIAEGRIQVRDLLRRHISSGQMKALKKNGRVLCNGKEVNARYLLQAGDSLTLCFSEEKQVAYQAKLMDVKVLYEDEDYLVVDKGVGISCIPNQKDRDNLLEGVSLYYPDDTFHVLTRLDKDTSGLVLLARSSLAASAIAEIKKLYLALVEGILETSVRIDAPIARGEDIKRIVSDAGKPSVTIVRPIEKRAEGTLVECELLTGRTHQIRVHLSHIGHPIVGDTLYGNGVGAYNSGQRLLCYRLEWVQPFTKERISVVSERRL